MIDLQLIYDIYIIIYIVNQLYVCPRYHSPLLVVTRNVHVKNIVKISKKKIIGSVLKVHGTKEELDFRRQNFFCIRRLYPKKRDSTVFTGSMTRS